MSGGARGGAGVWRPGPALQRAVLVVGLLLAAALVTGRAELVALAAPLLLGTVWALLVGPWPGRGAAGTAGEVQPPRAVARAPRVAGQGARVAVQVDVEHADGGQLAVVRLPGSDSFPHGRTVAAPLDDGHAVLRASALLSRWGTVTVARPDLLVAGADALMLYGPVVSLEGRVAVVAASGKVPAAPLPPRSGGLVGVHRTRLPGDGTDLLDVREFRPGDRMRRIDWRVSARRGVLHVRRTAVDADAEIVLCLDTRYDVGPDVATWPSPPGLGAQGTSRVGSSLDVSVRATVSLAETFLRQGDRVSVLDLARPQLSVPRGTGVRHLRRIRRQLAEVAVHLQARRLVLRRGSVPPSAVVVLVSPMLDEAASDLAVSLRRRGREVVVLDVLPRPLVPPRRSRSELLAHRLLQAERDLRLRSLRSHGVLVATWDPVAVPVLLRQRARDRRRVA
jgi:uncharacterized protein (DUF58 family)